jgi:sec-independent protein translocase protein TatC
MSILLFLGGAAYGYLLFFPVAFEFLSSNAVQAGFQPNYSIVKWAQFIFLLSISFGLAAQLPLVMSGLSLSGIVPYQTFRDYWKHAIVGLYAMGALFTPPDPLTQVMWATPLVFLYWFSLSLTKFLVNAQQAGERIDAREVFGEHWNVIAGVGVVAAAVVFFGGRALTNGAADPYLPLIDEVALVGPYLDGKLPDMLATATLFGVDATVALVGLAALVGLLAAFAALVRQMFVALDELVASEAVASGAAPASAGDPEGINIAGLSAEGVRAAPVEAFVEMPEDRALALSRRARPPPPRTTSTQTATSSNPSPRKRRRATCSRGPAPGCSRRSPKTRSTRTTSVATTTTSRSSRRRSRPRRSASSGRS